MMIQTNRQQIDELSKLRVLQQKDDWQEEYRGTDAELFAKTKRYLQKHLNRDLFIFAELNDGVIIATCGIQLHNTLPQCCDNGRYGYVCNVYTLPDYRRQGIQTRLFAALLHFSKLKNFERIQLSSDNPVAISIYENFNFKKDDWAYIWLQQ